MKLFIFVEIKQSNIFIDPPRPLDMRAVVLRGAGGGDTGPCAAHRHQHPRQRGAVQDTLREHQARDNTARDHPARSGLYHH